MQKDPLIVRRVSTDALLAQLQAVNEQANAEITYVTDQAKYGKSEWWENADLEGEEGDCEDIVMAKYKRLRALGWDQAMLDFVMCWDETGTYHCILAARLDIADMMLDSRQFSFWNADARGADSPMASYKLDITTVGGTFANWRNYAQEAA